MKEKNNNKRLFKVPVGKEILGDKEVNIETLIKFRIESNFVDSKGNMCIKEVDVNYTRWSKDLKTTPRTLKKNIDKLVSSGLLTKFMGEDNEEYYSICADYKGEEVLIEEDLLKRLLQVKVKHLVKTYLIYYKHTKAFGSCRLVQAEILKNIGLSVNGKNEDVLRKVNNKLVELNLIRISKVRKYEGRKTRTLLSISTY